MKLLDLHNLSQKRLKALHQSGIHSPLDLLYLFPRRYIDKSNIQSIRNLHRFSEPVTIVGKVKSKNVAGYKNKRRLEVIIQDNTGVCKAVFFRGWKYFINLFEEDSWVSLYGTAKKYGKYMSMAHPEVEQLESLDEMKIPDSLIPIYPSNKHFSKAYISNKILTGWIQDILKSVKIIEFLPDDILSENNFHSRKEAFQIIHK
ncbi:MAG: ATP-dependent DNA helicase RecG, partial [Bacteroidetes bacterium]|nr:ATP-dependent DNA helicase RecG [Bacteroidota bacterium]